MVTMDIVVVNLLILMTQLLRVNVHVITILRQRNWIVVVVFVLPIVVVMKATNHTTGVRSSGILSLIHVILYVI